MMMPKAVRLGDRCTGHGGYPARPNNEASSDVEINDLGAHRVGDSYPVHCDDDSCHVGVAAEGSPDIEVNDKPKCRVGDAVSCGSTMGTGSDDVELN